MSKTLSNGTLSLRFMQNAQRARQQAQVELEQAKIKDEAEWEVSRETKEAWGIISSSSDINGAETKTSHEASYIPFMFSTGSSSAEAGSARPRGRRTFNAKGSEVKEEPSEIKAGDPVQAAQTENSKAKRLTSISGFKPPLPVKHKDSGKVKAKTAQESIREDIRTRPPSYHSYLKDDQATSTPGGFVRPAGVDGPSVNGSKTAGSSMSLKRERDSIAGDTSTTTKRKKKKEVQLIE